MTEIIIRAFPMPPSINDAYRNLNVPGMRGRAKTAEYRQFEQSAASFAMRNGRAIAQARALTEHLEAGTVLEVEYFFLFKNVLMKNDGKKDLKRGKRRRLKGEPKTNDTSNRIKVLEDVLSKILGVDDCWFWSGKYDKRQNKEAFFPECVDISLRLLELDEFGNRMASESAAGMVRTQHLN